MKSKNKTLYKIIILLAILFVGAIFYILYLKGNEIHTNNEYTLITGRNNQIMYNDEEIIYTVTFFDYSINETRIYTERINLDNEKVKTALIISGALTNDTTEDGFYIMDDGTVKVMHATFSSNGDITGVNFEVFDILKDYKVSKINEIKYVADTNGEGLMFGTYCDIVTIDGEHLTFTV